ncbi:hypothetical protein Golob_003859 [Gossypium lobatum]|uniref:RNase H type-1 domain-containing protein n=1 Tax=Gossypium lobatum TaxID=34289 RepID=A0A7J8MZT5_9ROSI|nr:hypothetical protein [Gossypium lobatum]
MRLIKNKPQTSITINKWRKPPDQIYQQVASAFATEALVCRRAIQISIDMHWEKVIIEGDSLSIIIKNVRQ